MPIPNGFGGFIYTLDDFANATPAQQAAMQAANLQGSKASQAHYNATTGQSKILGGSIFNVFKPVDEVLNTALQAPVFGEANSRFEQAKAGQLGDSAFDIITGEQVLPSVAAPSVAALATPASTPAPTPPPAPRPMPMQPAPTVITLPAAPIGVAAPAPKKQRRENIAVDEVDAARAGYGAGLISGDSGLPIDPLGRRGRGAVGHSTLLGR